MADIWMDVSTALAEVPVNIAPLVDDTDFKTIETAVAYNAAGMTLLWHFVTTAGVMSSTAVTPTTAGVHDWAHSGGGMYSLEIPASGGTINNAGQGFGWFTGSATGVLPWRGPVIGFRDTGLNDLLIDANYSTTRGLAGTALPAVASGSAGAVITSGTGTAQLSVTSGVASANTVQLSGDSAAADNAEAFFDGTGYAGTNNVIPTVTAVTGLTASDVAAIKAKTDSLTYTVANVLDANIQHINDVVITGNGGTGTEFGV